MPRRFRFPLLVCLIACLFGLPVRVVRSAGAQVCSGDCGHDGEVTIDDLIAMVAIALSTATLDSCAAGDANNDGDVTIDDIIIAVNIALSSCPASPTPSPTPSEVTLRIGSTTGAVGQVANFSVVISTAGRSVDAVQNEIRLAANAPIRATATGDPDCASTTGQAAAAFVPPGCSLGTTCTAVRVTYARQQVPDGTVLYTCTVSISTTSPPGPIALECQNAVYVTSAIEQFDAVCTDGTLQVTP